MFVSRVLYTRHVNVPFYIVSELKVCQLFMSSSFGRYIGAVKKLQRADISLYILSAYRRSRTYALLSNAETGHNIKRRKSWFCCQH